MNSNGDINGLGADLPCFAENKLDISFWLNSSKADRSSLGKKIWSSFDSWDRITQLYAPIPVRFH